ncbi:MAG: ATP-binding protein [Anaerolineales bacterium]
MLKNLFDIPSTFESDDYRCKRSLNILLVSFTGLALLVVILVFTLRVFHSVPVEMTTQPLAIAAVMIALNGALLAANRWLKTPGWLNAAIFVTCLTVAIFLADKPDELSNGTSLVAWVVPIMVGVVLLRPVFVFLITSVISVFILIFSSQANGVPNYYAVITLFAIALLCWLAMSIANQAIRDARRQTANIEAILNGITDGVLVLDRDGGFISANRALLKMIPEDKLREMNSKPLEETIQWKRTVFSVTASAIPGVGSVVIFRDETRRHETERAKDALLATASHELRTPLGAVMNYLELLMMLNEMGQVNTAKFQEHLTRALENCKRLLNLINDILDQAQFQAGVLELKQQIFNLPALLEKSRQPLDALLKEKGLSYELNIFPGVPAEISSDPDRMQQMLWNLISNAVKFTNQGGITVNVSLLRTDTLCIEVIDTGPGIPDEQLPDIFEPFRRGSNYAQREHQGAGLGLSIAREIVARMGGEISVSSALGVGSTFIVFLPLMQAQPQSE